VLQIAKNRLPHLKLDWVLLRASTLSPSDAKGFISPIEIAQSEIGNLAAAKTVDDKQKDDCLGA
jgi:hypothetical protein